jgi:hypothetical protein
VTDALRTAEYDALRAGTPARDWTAFTLVDDPLTRVARRMPR